MLFPPLTHRQDAELGTCAGSFELHHTQTELQLSLLVQGGSLRSLRAARPSAGSALLSSPVPARPTPVPRPQQSATCRQRRGTLRLGRSAPRLYGATLARASQIMTPASCFTGQVHRLPDAPEAYGLMITRAKATPPKATRPTRLTSASLSLYSTRQDNYP